DFQRALSVEPCRPLNVARHPFANRIVERASGIERVVEIEHPGLDVGKGHQSPLPRSCVGALGGSRPRRAVLAAGLTASSPAAGVNWRGMTPGSRKSRSSKSTTKPSRARAPIGVNSVV